MRLAHAGWELILRPALGGSVAAFRRDGEDVFRPTPPGAGHPLDTACFPLVPYANRIADGRLGTSAQAPLPRNVAGQAHPLHGVGWLSEWSVTAATGTGAVLAHRQDGDSAWPWRYTAEQRFEVADDGLRIALSVTNRDDRPMPVSLGLHPYFTRAHVRTLRFAADGVWLADAAMLPTEHVAADRLGDWAMGETLDRPSLIDHCYTGWSGTATIARDDGDLILSGTATPFLHLFTPPGEDFFCAEPVTAMPDAINRAGMATLAPGETTGIAMAVLSAA